MNSVKENRFEQIVQNREVSELFKSSESFGDFRLKMNKLGYTDKNLIEYVFEFYESALLDKDEMSQADYNRILNRLVVYQRTKKQSQKRKIFIYNLLKVASVIAIIIGSYSVFQYFSENSSQLEKFAKMSSVNGDNSIIMLSDGTSHIIDSNNAFIEYNKESQKVIVEKSPDNKSVLENKAKKGKEQLNQVFVPFGKQQKIILSDGTFVYLNSGSKLVYPATFTGNKREVYLLGEGFFEVKEDKKHPFIVRTDNIDIEVLGTKFNVSSYKDEKITSAVLVEGSVKVLQEKGIFITREYYLKPNEGLFYSNDNQNAVIEKVDVTNYTSWKSGIFQFRDLAFGDVIQKVKKYYNRNIELTDTSYSNTLISGKLYLNNDVSLVIESLSRTVNASYIENDDGKFIFK